MKKNARGGYKVEGLGAAADNRAAADAEYRAEVYGPSTQCPPGECGHVLTERQWNRTLRKKKRSRSA